MKSFIFVLVVFSTLCALSLARQELEVTEQMYFDLDIDGFHEGRIIVGLFGKDVPKTVENFKQIATVGINNKTYIGTKFHRIIKNFMIQGGDIVFNDGRGGISIYGDKFDDENFNIKHTGSGFLSMANSGPNTNGCQFFITTAKTPWLDGHHTIFGKILSGMKAIRAIENIRISATSRRPSLDATIRTAGFLPTPQPFMITDDDIKENEFFWGWVKAASIPVTVSLATIGLFQWFYYKLSLIA
uniref:Peptidyl-prolyl cis-trans isomerase n=1 Tax=Cacopsylla melanoneura TaxID=428564 RepID=A0A8D8PZK1_9HEMI